MEFKEIVIASGPVIIENNRVFLVRHGDSPEESKIWKFPGGKVDNSDFKSDSDILLQTCKREAREEIGTDVEIVAPLKTIMIAKPNSDKCVILVHYLCKINGEINLGDRIIEGKWFNLDEVPETSAPNVKKIIEEYLK